MVRDMAETVWRQRWRSVIRRWAAPGWNFGCRAA